MRRELPQLPSRSPDRGFTFTHTYVLTPPCPHPVPHRREQRSRTTLYIEAADFLHDKSLRKTIHARERGQCFYCLRRTTPTFHCLDHVVPRSQSGSNSYRNLVSSCMECNSHKGEKHAGDFLRLLYRERRLTAPELAARLRALDALASGKLRPPLP